MTFRVSIPERLRILSFLLQDNLTSIPLKLFFGHLLYNIGYGILLSVTSNHAKSRPGHLQGSLAISFSGRHRHSADAY